jgi:hypothetical protein
MLLLVAVLAAALFGLRDYMRLRNAREHFGWVYARWQVHRIKIEDLTTASERLAERETDSIWVSKRAAEEEHVARMTEVWDGLESYFMESSEEYFLKAHDHLQKNIDKHRDDQGPLNQPPPLS